MEPKQKQLPVGDGTGDRSKVWCCKEQYCIGIWNVRFMNQGKLEVVKQEMTRVNIVILGISETRWTGMGEFNSDDHYIYSTVSRNPLRRNEVAIIVNKRLRNAVLGCNLKNDRMLSVHFQGKSFNITVIQVPWPVMLKKLKLNSSMKAYKPTRTNTQKRCPFHYRGRECKSRKSRNTWSNRQIWSWNTEWSRAKANIVLLRERTSRRKHPLPTTQEKTLHMDITRWLTLKSYWLYSLQANMEKLYTISKNQTSSWLWLKSCTPYCQIQT